MIVKKKYCQKAKQLLAAINHIFVTFFIQSWIFIFNSLPNSFLHVILNQKMIDVIFRVDFYLTL